MQNIILPLLSLLLISSCSQVNTRERDYYKENKKMRHGIVPTDYRKIKMNNNAPIDAKAAARGEVLYKQNCYKCHGARGDGKGPDAVKNEMQVRNLREVIQSVPNFKFYMMISQWKENMPGWKAAFSPSEISDLEQYVRSLLVKN